MRWTTARSASGSGQPVQEPKHGLREGFGVLIVEVLKETPAAQSGLANGDLVVAVRDRPVVDTRTLQRLVAATPVGEELPLTVLRRGDEHRAAHAAERDRRAETLHVDRALHRAFGGTVLLDELVSVTYPLAEYEQAIHAMESGTIARGVLTMALASEKR